MDGEHVGPEAGHLRAGAGRRRLCEFCGFEDKGCLKTQVAGGGTVGGKKDGRRRQRRYPDPVMEPY